MILFKDGQKLAEGAQIRQELVLAEGERVSLTLLALGSGDASFDVDIVGPAANVELKGLYVCKDDDRLKVNVNLRHSSGGSYSNQLFRGIVGGRARASFAGRIVVSPDAQKTEAYQSNQNLQLSDDCTVETLPQLEIYADDVKCSHGATVGSLDMDEQFYMRSRGISEQEARRLQMISFLAPVLDGMDEDTRAMVFESL